ncbi:hypothetical protein GUITHDRAFT_118165 [Guillardia theta CCMP2712]|uniref:Uncharacterized protein n=1 Tax=Guillardia theta (strain CCMP2712) TaxID=905079 RepID=L1IIA6_GUITC|nr:hypothetical protein GUITHDRAFT_118165 [Guillardia theta CCMP2712]EKX35674.1 hypothetical protein GUITHDRAFT_118165 [Guillardia theta CCMP2712]|eukprot:XP_005822654.1 hypothetical protein GUITHDRAFT_118165 [Guillardia theta CCMP2712]
MHTVGILPDEVPVPALGQVCGRPAYESEAIAYTLNTYSQCRPSDHVLPLDCGSSCHTLVRSVLRRLEGQGVEHEHGSCELKTPGSPPVPTDLGSYIPPLHRILNANNSIFDSCYEVRMAMLRHAMSAGAGPADARGGG